MMIIKMIVHNEIGEQNLLPTNNPMMIWLGWCLTEFFFFAVLQLVVGAFWLSHFESDKDCLKTRFGLISSLTPGEKVQFPTCH
jgi:hypothetical protein